PAVDVAHRGPEPGPQQPGEDRVPPAVQGGHGTRQDPPAAALQPAALDQVVALPQLGDELRQLEEVVAVVGVPHHDQAPPRGGDAAHQRVAVAGRVDDHDPGAAPGGDPAGVVGAAVVGDHDLAGDPHLVDRRPGLLDAGAEGLRLVEARHDDRQLDG